MDVAVHQGLTPDDLRAALACPEAVVQEIAHLDGIGALKAVPVAPSGVR